jgi:group I intron endonuclease
MYIIYQVTNIVNKKSYVGFTSQLPEKRWYQHLWEAKNRRVTPLYASIRKYGEDKFLFSILEEGLDLDIGLKIREPYWISVIKPEYNLTEGGEGSPGYKYTDERRTNAAIRMKGNKNTLGHKIPEKQKLQQSKFMQGNQFAVGARHTEEWKKKKSEAMKQYHFNRRKQRGV